MKSLGYSYEELRDWDPKYHSSGRFDEALYCSDIRASLVRNYGWALPPMNRIRRLARAATTAARAPATEAPAAEAEENKEGPELHFTARRVHREVPRSSAVPVEQRQFDEYVVNVRVDRYEFL